MSFFDSLHVSASGLTAQKLRMDITSENIANVNTTRTGDGTPYKRKAVLFQQKSDDFFTFSQTFESILNKPVKGTGVRVHSIVKDNTPGAKVYEPSHPDADKDGYVMMPNVNIVTEMVNMISASRSYEANVTALNTTKAMMAKTLEIGR